MNGNNRHRMVVQERDKRMLGHLPVMRIIDREQAKVLGGFGSTTRANTRLLALHREGLLRRCFQGTTAGGKKALYTLSPKGARFIGAPYRGFRHGNDELLVTNFFVTHQLAVNQVYCAVACRPILAPDARCVRWIAFSNPVVPSLLPDGYFEISTPHVATGFFLEVDLGNEGLAVWKGKTGRYLAYAASGEFKERFGLSQFRVVVIANTGKRMEAIRRAIREVTEKIFWFSSFEAIGLNAFWSSIWLRPAGDEPKPLL